MVNDRKIAVSTNNIIPFVPAGKIRCFITDKLRKDTPEENIRQRWVRSLVEEYKYNKADIALEFRIKMGVARKKADIVVFKEGAPKRQEAIFLIVEAKHDNVLPKDKKEGIEQLKSYMAACSACRYGLWVGSERQSFEKILKDGSIEEGLADIPKQGELEPKIPIYADLVPAQDLKAPFRRCHNYIYANQGLQKAEAFHEMLKIIFCKVYDETETSGKLLFFVRNEERRSEAGQRKLLTDRIEPLFKSVKERYPYIFKENEGIELNRRVLAYIVSELQRISLLQTKTDIKGAAYEELVGANLRGDRGEFFTPRNVCDMTVKMIMSLFSVSKLSNIRVLDTCCGTGGFLVSYLNVLRETLKEQEYNKTGKHNEEWVNSRIKEICSRNLFGTDINPFLVRTCQMNLVMHGDGSSNVFRADALTFPAEWDNPEVIKHIEHKNFDIVLTNPPFGGNAQVDDPHLLSRYELAHIDNKNSRNSMPAEQLFVEGAWNFVKPGGYLGIVLPDSILNNPSLEFIRRWLLKRSRIVASIDMPKETFAISKGVPNPSVLIVQRLTQEELKLAEAGALDNYDIFMAIPKTAGIDKRGTPIYLKNFEGLEILNDEMQHVIDDEISLVADNFSEWIEAP